MKKAAVLLMCALMLSGTVSCAKKDADPESVSEPSAAYPENPDYRLDEFDDELIAYLSLNGYDSTNFLVSPEAFRASLCIAAEGAQGNTRTELLKAAGFSGMDTMTSWCSELNEPIANSVWSNEDTFGSFNASYASNISEKYNANAYSCKSDEIVETIKDMTTRKTDGMPFDEADTLDGVSSVIISTLNLQAAWKGAFAGAEINDGVFEGYDGKEYTMKFAEQTGEYLYADENDVQVLVIPMENDMSFVCFTGNRTDRFSKLKSVKPQKVHVALPVFELESVFDSKDFFGFLLEHGVSDAINHQTANFYNMCSDGDWFMQEMVQKSRISFDGAYSSEKGGADDADNDGDVKEFIADRSFSFMVFSDLGTENQHMMLYGQIVNGN